MVGMFRGEVPDASGRPHMSDLSDHRRSDWRRSKESSGGGVARRLRAAAKEAVYPEVDRRSSGRSPEVSARAPKCRNAAGSGNMERGWTFSWSLSRFGCGGRIQVRLPGVALLAGTVSHAGRECNI